MIQEVIAGLAGPLGYAALGIVAFADTLIGVGFFVLGEVAFVAAGAAVAATGHWGPALVVLVAAWAGDLTSFALGRRYGRGLVLRWLGSPRRRRTYRSAQRALRRRGWVFVILSRLMGPTAWITPFLAGTMQMPAAAFAGASAVGVMLGVGQFLLLGALGASWLPMLAGTLGAHIWAIALLVGMAGAAAWVWYRTDGGRRVRFAKAVGTAALLFVLSNIFYFFVLDTHPRTDGKTRLGGSLCALGPQHVTARPGATGLHLPQPVNAILISDGSGAELMAALGWQQNQTFTHHRIGIDDFLELLWHGTPPVTELYLAGLPADSAHQLPGTLKTREHIRWWGLGPGLSLGAISRDEELAIKYYRHLPALLHDIAPEVDRSRDFLAAQVLGHSGFRVLGYAQLAQPRPDAGTRDYQTDGRAVVIARRGITPDPEALACLGLSDQQVIAAGHPAKVPQPMPDQAKG